MSFYQILEKMFNLRAAFSTYCGGLQPSAVTEVSLQVSLQVSLEVILGVSSEVCSFRL